MNPRQVYQWSGQIHERMALTKWQALGLAIFSIGIVLSERSTVSKIAEKMWMMGRADSLERRLQRWLANSRIVVETCCRMWSKWVMSSLIDSQRIILLVDLTKLGEWMDIIVVGLAYRNRCIPLAWRCMRGKQKWAQSQIEVIAELLGWVAAGVPDGQIPLVQADRGIGNSSQLVAVITQLEWHYLFRVRDTVRMRSREGHVQPLAVLIQRGGRWSGEGHIFKKGGWVSAYVHLIWRRSMREPWCLVTNAPDITGALYAVRMWQEESFRDLKSGGWHWHRSLVRIPAHAERLILALVLAYTWVLSLGTRAIRAGKALRKHLSRGNRRTYSVFRLGLRYLYHLIRAQLPICMGLLFIPSLTFP